MLTKKDYTLIANILSKCDNFSEEKKNQINEILSKDNPRFNKGKFWDAVNLNKLNN